MDATRGFGESRSLGRELRLASGEVEVRGEYGALEGVACPTFGSAAKRYDARLRRWRHLPTGQYKSIMAAEVPRVACPELGVKVLAVPRSEPGSGFTALFEALVIDCCGKRASSRWHDSSV